MTRMPHGQPRALPLLLAIFVFAISATAAKADTINVSDDASLAAALAAVSPGDIIILADGAYSGFTVSRSGTADNPILIESANPGGANITTGVIHLSQTSYVTLKGLTVTSLGASQTVDGSSLRFIVWFDATQNCRLTNSVFTPPAPQARDLAWVLLGGAGDSNRIDHNAFGPGNSSGGAHYVWPRGQVTIPGVTPPADRTDWANGLGPVNPNMPRHTLIDHNYFHDKASSSGEAIVLGGLGTTGDYQDTFSTVEYNIFQNCNGDPEVVSVKSSSNTIRYNTVLTSGGSFSLRAGNNSSVYGNFSFQGTTGAGGVRIWEMNHKVYNNYIEGGTDYPIIVGGGNPYSSPSFGHAQVVNLQIVNNTIVNPGRQVRIGHDDGTAPFLPPLNSTFANNIIVGTGTLYSENLPVVNYTRSGNITFPFNPKKTGFTVIDPQLVSLNGFQQLSATSPAINAGDPSYLGFVNVDIQGQARDMQPDIGADEFSSDQILHRPLALADVGPNAVLPVITAPTSILLTATGPSGAVATFTASATDNQGASVPVTLNPPSGSAFPAGTTVVTASAIDAAGNTASAQFTVTVSFPVTASGLLFSRVNKTYSGTVTVLNNSANVVNGPLFVVLTNLTPGVTLTNSAITVSGSPAVQILDSASTLNPGSSATASVVFNDPSNARITFTPIAEPQQ